MLENTILVVENIDHFITNVMNLQTGHCQSEAMDVLGGAIDGMVDAGVSLDEAQAVASRPSVFHSMKAGISNHADRVTEEEAIVRWMDQGMFLNDTDEVFHVKDKLLSQPGFVQAQEKRFAEFQPCSSNSTVRCNDGTI